MPLHVEVIAQVNRAPYVAERRGSALLASIAQALAANDGQGFVAFIGHDTNIANVAALLGLHWAPPGRVSNEIPPGAALIFERWRVADRTEVRVRFLAPSPQQMHSAQPVGGPQSTAVSSACGASCGATEFAARAPVDPRRVRAAPAVYFTRR